MKAIKDRRAIVEASYWRHGLAVRSWLAPWSAVPLRTEPTRPDCTTAATAWRSAVMELKCCGN